MELRRARQQAALPTVQQLPGILLVTRQGSVEWWNSWAMRARVELAFSLQLAESPVWRKKPATIPWREQAGFPGWGFGIEPGSRIPDSQRQAGC